MKNHYVPNLEEILRAHKAGMTDRQIIKLCKKDPSGRWFEENRKSMIENGVMR
jgi:hypothetical protein